MQDLATSTRPNGELNPPLEEGEFDGWLRLHLGRLYAGVLTEPVPEHLLRLVRGQQG